MKELTLKELKAVVRYRVRGMLTTAHKQGRTVALADCIAASRQELRRKLREINRPFVRGFLDNEYELWISSAEKDIKDMPRNRTSPKAARQKSSGSARIETPTRGTMNGWRRLEGCVR